MQTIGMLLPLNLYCKTAQPWKPNYKNNMNKTLLSKALIFTEPSKTYPNKVLTMRFCLSISSSASVRFEKKSQPRHKNFSKERGLHLGTINRSHGLKSSLFDKPKERHSNPIQILRDGGDLSQKEFWAVIRLLKETSRAKEVLQVFDLWKHADKSRINELNYEKIVGLLVEEGMMEDAVSTIQEMKSYGLKPSMGIHNSVIRGLARRGNFEDALFYLKKMEDASLKPDTDTYDGLIEAYGKHGMYDEMGQCLKKMESDGCLPDHITYNLLIREFSEAGLLKKMESTYQSLLSKGMDLQSSTLVAMLEAYVSFGLLDKMERVCRRVLNSKISVKEDLIRKVAAVYIENHMFSRLDSLGFDLSSKTGKTDLVWCLRILSHACLLSRKGIDSVLQEMETDGVPWNVTVANIIALAYLKMKDFKHLQIVLSELPARYVKPDIATVGVLFDACTLGFNGASVKKMWRKIGFFDEAVEMNTDSLVLTAFGKGQFLRNCEVMYSSLESKARKKEIWTYRHLINLVLHNRPLPRLMGIDQS